MIPKFHTQLVRNPHLRKVFGMTHVRLPGIDRKEIVQNGHIVEVDVPRNVRIDNIRTASGHVLLYSSCRIVGPWI